MKISTIYKQPTLSPVDASTSTVTSNGFQYEPAKKIVQPRWEAPPPAQLIPRGVRNVKGVKFGDFTVVGLYDLAKNSWIVKCTCGYYEIRTKKAILNPSNNQDSCQHCQHTKYLKKLDLFQSTGKHYNEKERAERHWKVQPALKTLPVNAPNCIKERFGKFTVIGMHAERRGCWVVRCDCGDYEIRKLKTLRNATEKSNSCINCQNSDD